MSHYTANLRDIEFCLFDLLGRDKVMGTNPYGEVDRETAIGMLEEMKRLCENDLAASFVEGDRFGAILNKATGNVTLPESFKKSYKAYVDGEWWRLDAPVDLGGMKVPPSVRWAMAEMDHYSTIFFHTMLKLSLAKIHPLTYLLWHFSQQVGRVSDITGHTCGELSLRLIRHSRLPNSCTRFTKILM